MIKWLDSHTGAIQALAAILTVLIAIGALIGVKVQLDTSERLQREQSARDTYREFLNLSINKPEFGQPNYCAIEDVKEVAAYENYVEYMLYTAEQAIGANPDWEGVFLQTMAPHADYLCSIKDWAGYSDQVQALAGKFQAQQCRAVKPCDDAK
jgi:hypothetical protein